MKKSKLVVETEHGTFTRTTAREYTHIAVHFFSTGVVHQATWHFTEDAAIKSGSGPYYEQKREDKIYKIYEISKENETNVTNISKTLDTVCNVKGCNKVVGLFIYNGQISPEKGSQIVRIKERKRESWLVVCSDCVDAGKANTRSLKG